LICAAAEMGAKKLIVGLGGSATIDCGIGAAQACGLPVLLRDGQTVVDSEPLTGRDLESVLFVKRGRGGKADRLTIEAACDVSNPLCGPHGAAAVYGPQKGATPGQVKWFDDQLRRIAGHTGNETVAELPGAGAAGGLGFALAAFFGAELRPGIEIVIEATRLEDHLRGADLCITGEGRLDAQSASGKTVAGVARLCRKLGVPCVALCGAIGEGAECVLAAGVTAYHGICDNSSGFPDAMNRAKELLADAAASLARRTGSGK
jgi:glycerate 2-kinase